MNKAGRVAVVGAGWAGLACAVELATAGIPVTVYEAARQAGGRARSVALDGHTLDNGQHLFVGAYRETLRLIRLVGENPEALMQRLPLRIEFPATQPAFRLALPQLPAPWHLAFGLLAARGATLGEKISAARFMQHLKRRRYRLARDTTVADWLDEEGQHGAIRRCLWEPLCLAALTTAPAHASAQIFANVLRDSLGGQREATDLLLARTDLGRVFPAHAARYIAAHGGELQLCHRITGFERDGKGWQVGDIQADDLVLAVPPHSLPQMLAHRSAHAPLLGQLATYSYEPIATAYLAYPEDLRLPFPMLGMAGPTGQWVFDRGALDGNAGMMAFVLSANGDWDTLEDGELVQRLHHEFTALVGPLPTPRWQRVIRERRATFSCHPELPRPGNETAEPGLWLAGDYTCADYPATLEGAIRSGVEAARGILAGR